MPRVRQSNSSIVATTGKKLLGLVSVAAAAAAVWTLTGSMEVTAATLSIPVAVKLFGGLLNKEGLGKILPQIKETGRQVGVLEYGAKRAWNSAATMIGPAIALIGATAVAGAAGITGGMISGGIGAALGGLYAIKTLSDVVDDYVMTGKPLILSRSM